MSYCYISEMALTMIILCGGGYFRNFVKFEGYLRNFPLFLLTVSLKLTNIYPSFATISFHILMLL